MQIFLRCIWLQTMKEFIGLLTWLEERLLLDDDKLLLMLLPSELLVKDDAFVAIDDADELEFVDRSELEVLVL